jgi:outer membrane protein TolC
VISIIVAVSLSATPIRLEEAREQARGNTRALQAEIDRRRAGEAVNLARAPLLPQVNLSATFGGVATGPQRFFATRPIVDPETSEITGYVQEPVDVPGATRGMFDLNVGVSQLLFDAGRWAQLRQAGAQAEAAQGQAYEEQLTSELEAVRRFYALHRAERTRKVLEERVRGSQSLFERSAALYEAGKRRKEDAISAQVNLGNDRIQAILQRSAIVATETDLGTWLLRPPGERLETVEPAELAAAPRPVPSLDEALAAARENRPLLSALAAQVRASEEAIAAAQAGWLPSISANLFYGRSAPDPRPFFLDLSRQNAVSGSIGLNWNIFSGLATRAQEDDARLVRDRAQLAFGQAERDVAGDVRKALEALAAQVEAAEVARANREVAREGLLLAEERFAAGLSTTLEVRDAQLKVTNAELVQLESRIDVEIARAALERAMGTLSRGALK